MELVFRLERVLSGRGHPWQHQALPKLEFQLCGGDGSDLSTWRPDDEQCVSVWLELSIGEAGHRGADSFTLRVGTPEGIVAYQDGTGQVATQGCMVVSEWSWPDIERAVTRLVTQCDLGSFRMSVEELEKYFFYEYQDYNERPERKQVVPIVRSFDSAEVHLPSWDPVQPEHACIAVEMSIGVPKQSHTETFSVTVAIPAGLRAARSEFVLSDRAMLLLPSYSWDAARARLEDLVGHCRGNDWAECRAKLMRSFVSERE